MEFSHSCAAEHLCEGKPGISAAGLGGLGCDLGEITDSRSRALGQRYLLSLGDHSLQGGAAEAWQNIHLQPGCTGLGGF
ncbi:hypothetical protein CapIbe_006984 [Capra ibex]